MISYPTAQVQVDPEDLIPKLPKPRDLHPFPTTEAMVSCASLSEVYRAHAFLHQQVYGGHTGMVRCVDIEPLGQWMASGESPLSLARVYFTAHGLLLWHLQAQMMVVCVCGRC